MRKSLTNSAARRRRGGVHCRPYIEDPRELIAGHAVQLLRNGVETFPPGWRRSKPRASASRWRCTFSATTSSAGVRRRADRAAPARRRGALLYDFVGCRDTRPSSSIACARRACT
jgi:hypothetical protein